MSDERDETRRFPPFDDGGPSDAAQAAAQSAAQAAAQSAAQSAAQAAEKSAAQAAAQADGAQSDAASSRTDTAWSGRAQVRAPQPSRTAFDTDWPAGPVAEPRDRWWMPIVMGIVVLVTLAVLGWAIYLIMENAGGDDSPAPAPTTVATTTATTATTTPTTEPTTTTPSATPSTTEPTTTEVTVPALRGLTLAEARAALDGTGLSIRVIYRDSDAPAGTVIDSDPAEGQEVPPDTRVTLVVAAQSTATTPTGTTTTLTRPTQGAGGGGDEPVSGW